MQFAIHLDRSQASSFEQRVVAIKRGVCCVPLAGRSQFQTGERVQKRQVKYSADRTFHAPGPKNGFNGERRT